MNSMADGVGLPQSREINGLSVTNRVSPPIDSVGVFGVVTNRNRREFSIAGKRPAQPSIGSRGPVADRLHEIAHQLARLCPDRRDPEAFHVAKSELTAELRSIARAIGRAA